MTIYFGENLKRLRKKKELTQESLAETVKNAKKLSCITFGTLFLVFGFIILMIIW